MADAVGARRPAEGPLRGAAETDARRHAAGDGRPAGDVDQHRLQRLAVHVERLLAEIVDARAEVLDGCVGIEVAEFAAFGGDAARDLEQAVAIVGDRPHRGRSCGVAAQGAVLDEPGDHAGGLSLGKLRGSEPGHRDRGSAVGAAAQPARDGGMVDVDAVVPEPAPKLRGGCSLRPRARAVRGRTGRVGSACAGSGDACGCRP